MVKTIKPRLKQGTRDVENSIAVKINQCYSLENKDLKINNLSEHGPQTPIF